MNIEPDLSFNASLDIWHYMTYQVAKILHIRPLTILNEWSCEELLVSFGIYMNDVMSVKYAEFESLDTQTKSKIAKTDRPSEYALKFVTFEQLEEMNRPLSQEEIELQNAQDAQMLSFMNGGGKLIQD